MKNIGKMTLDTPSDREIVLTREFDAPRQLVFDAHTKPELLQRWLTGRPGHTMPICEIDLRVGGAYRYVWRGPDGKEMTSKGFYREVVPPARLVATERFEPTWYEGEAVNTTTFVEQNGKTTVTLTIQCPSKEVCDGILKSGMERGVAYSFDQLEQILSSQLQTKES
jgi:uncharacterized protein YndB with AHSA1/START domain